MLDLVTLVCAAVEIALYALLGAFAVTLLLRARWAWRQGPLSAVPPPPPPSAAPFVTVQLPLRNEPAVAEGLLRGAAALDWPRDRIELQILDDSDDGTVEIVDRVAGELRASGHAIEVVRRRERRGYKAGALALGMQTARGDRFLILDADFRPDPTLLAALEAGLGEDHAFCQARWSYRNREASLLTRLQAAILDALFVIEQAAQSARGAPVQFNGTGGLWRREALVRAGGWDTSDDALTEDLDLSFRANETGRRGVTRADLEVATELPEAMAELRCQQARWVRGAGLALRTVGRRLWARAALADARQLLLHLLRHARQPVFVAAALRLPLMAWCGVMPLAPAWLGPCLFLLLLGAIAGYLGAARRRIDGDARAGAVLAPALFALSMGLSPALALAFVGGALGRRGGGFRRTAKTGGQAVPRSREPLDAGAALGVLVAVLALFAAALFFRDADVIGVVASVFVAGSCGWVALAP